MAKSTLATAVCEPTPLCYWALNPKRAKTSGHALAIKQGDKPEVELTVSSVLTFFTNPRSRGRTVRWMLEELHVEYETRILEFGKDNTAPEFLAINPMGKVPTIRHDGAVVTESAAICAYLAEAFPEAGLAPLPSERANYLRWMFFAAGPLESAMYDDMIGHRPEGGQQSAAGYGSLERVFISFESHLAHSAFMAGGRFTAADVFCGSQLYWATMFLPQVRDRAAISAYVDRATNRSAWKRAQEIDGLMPES